MGASTWSDSHYADRVTMRAATSSPTFAYDSDIRAGRARAGVHASLDPKGVVFRESRDSDAHPNSRPVAVLCDVTGSMSSVPKIVQKNLPKLMGLLIKKGYLDDPAILVGAIGDASPRCDNAPLQVGQFESGIEIEDCITNLYLEGGGGGHITESYELAMYFMANHTAHDSFDKRGEKGYLFIIGDEIPYAKVDRKQVADIIGDTISEDIAVETVVEKLKEKYEVFFILPKMANNFSMPAISKRWTELLGQRVIKLDDAEGICECIAAQIGMMEGKIDADDVEDDLVDAGTDRRTALAVGRSLVPVGAAGAKGPIQKMPNSGKGSTLGKW